VSPTDLLEADGDLASAFPCEVRSRASDRLAYAHDASHYLLALRAVLRRVAAVIAERVIEPDDWSCCAFAGDRGLLHPELTAAATAPEAAEVRAAGAAAHVSLNRTCELGMSRATGLPYKHILELLLEVSA
jgi:D-lactate dehydrogenase